MSTLPSKIAALACLLLLPTALADQRPVDPTFDPLCPYPEDVDWFGEPEVVACIDGFRNAQPLFLVQPTVLDALVAVHGYAVTVPNVGTLGIACAVATASAGNEEPEVYAPCDGVGVRGAQIGQSLYLAQHVPTTNTGPAAYLVEATLKAHYDGLGILGADILLVCPDPSCGAPVLLG